MRSKIALIALALVCLLVAPALSRPLDMGASKHDGCRFAANNLTEAQMSNMTLGELKKMMPQESADGLNGSCEFNKHNQSGNCSRGMLCEEYGARRFGSIRSRVSPLLLMDDITADQLGNMTLNQIKALLQKKMNELSNMTLGQIKLLEQQRMQKRDNMTFSELKIKKQERREVARIIGFVQVAEQDNLPGCGLQRDMDGERGPGQDRMARDH